MAKESRSEERRNGKKEQLRAVSDSFKEEDTSQSNVLRSDYNIQPFTTANILYPHTICVVFEWWNVFRKRITLHSCTIRIFKFYPRIAKCVYQLGDYFRKRVRKNSEFEHNQKFSYI